ncbi:MAG: sugar phosphate isomerase/epimerase [Chloroflexi bacterium]|nr:sugar phosphate isomerase/epimerase [Chloroflexota bacterium]
MEIGLYHSCLMEWDLDRLFSWARTTGYRALELHGGPRFRHVDWSAIAAGRVNPVLDAQEKYNVRVVGLMYGALIFFSADTAERDSAFERLETLLHAARRARVPLVSTFTGRDPTLTLDENLERSADSLRRIADLAERHEVDVAFENCPMFHVWPWVHNVAVSPAMWRRIFEIVPTPRMGLNFDPSHLGWQGIDTLAALGDFRDRIKLVQAKDTEILPDVQREEGMLSLRWWRHRIPGEGSIDWAAFFARLREVGYDSVVSIEHEDPVYEGSDERVLEGLARTRAHLEQFL